MTMTEMDPRDSGSADEPEPLSLANAGGRLLRAMPGLVRLAAVSGWHVAEWAVRTSVETAGEVVQALASGTLPTQTVRDLTSDLRSVGRQALGRSNPEDETVPTGRASPSGLDTEGLRAMGTELLYRSADVWLSDDVHPAYERILGELAPDEARILRFLATAGPQPAVDVRTGRPLGIGSELIAGGLSMIGLRSGVRNMERTNAYQNNLFRLGLIWFSREEVDPVHYQVVEVQPDVADAIKKAGRMPKIVRRSIHLTPFGEDFCQICLPVGEGSFRTNGKDPDGGTHPAG
jgi:hypothetical protein